MNDVPQVVIITVATTEFLKKRLGVKGPFVWIISGVVAVVTSVVSASIDGKPPVSGIGSGILSGLLASGGTDFIKKLLAKVGR